MARGWGAGWKQKPGRQPGSQGEMDMDTLTTVGAIVHLRLSGERVRQIVVKAAGRLGGAVG